jgi:hypothetical protein
MANSSLAGKKRIRFICLTIKRAYPGSDKALFLYNFENIRIFSQPSPEARK